MKKSDSADILNNEVHAVEFNLDSLLLLVKFNVALRPQRPYGLFETGGSGRPPLLSHTYLDFHTAPELWFH